jgi:hypothetical protein
MQTDFADADVAPRHLLEVSDQEPDELARLLLGRYRDGALRYPS